MTAPGLRDLQERFWVWLAAAPGGPPAPEPALVDLARSTPSLSAAARLGIYAGMYVARLVDVLRDDFPRVAAVMGGAAFRAAAAAHVGRRPSRHPSLRHLGQGFPETLAAAGPTPAWLPDLARLEWTRVEVFDAPDSPTLTLAALRAVPVEAWPALRLVPIPALAVLVADWPVHRVWAAGDDVPAALARERTALRVWRDGFDVHQAPMDAREERALDAVRAGASFADVCETFADLPAGEAAAEAGALLGRWIEDGLLAARTTTGD